MVPFLLLSCESSVSVKENPDRKIALLSVLRQFPIRFNKSTGHKGHSFSLPPLFDFGSFHFFLKFNAVGLITFFSSHSTYLFIFQGFTLLKVQKIQYTIKNKLHNQIQQFTKINKFNTFFLCLHLRLLGMVLSTYKITDATIQRCSSEMFTKQTTPSQMQNLLMQNSCPQFLIKTLMFSFSHVTLQFPTDSYKDLPENSRKH